MSKKKKNKQLRDSEGQFRWKTQMIKGKQKRTKVRMIDGMDVDEFVRLNADPIWAMQEGAYELLPDTAALPDFQLSKKDPLFVDDDDEIPF